ncbi:G-protein coupled receptor 83-like [Haemaphysalis longicornis]
MDDGDRVSPPWLTTRLQMPEDPCAGTATGNLSMLCSLLRNLSMESQPLLQQPRDVLVVVLYGLVVLVSVFGNTLVCHVVLRSRKMHTKTNVLIANLAVSDLLMTTLTIPLSASRFLLDNWPFGEALCYLAPFLQVTFVYVSTLSMTWIACDRYSVIVYPLRLRHLCPGHRAVACIWALAGMLSLPHAVFNRVVSLFTYRLLVRCQVQYPAPSAEFRRWLTLATFLTQYVLPLALTAYMYCRVSRTLWTRKALGALTREQQAWHTRSKHKSLKMLVLVVLCFAICWLPLNVYHLVVHFRDHDGPDRHNSSLFIFFHWLAMSSVCYNPFIYCWLNDSFRRGAMTCLACLLGCPKPAASWGLSQQSSRLAQDTSLEKCPSTDLPVTRGGRLQRCSAGRNSTLRSTSLGHSDRTTFV